MSNLDEQKKLVGIRAAELVGHGTVVGLGTGSTAKHFVDRLGERVREGLEVRAVPTSERTAEHARSVGIELVSLEDFPELDLAVDGADQVDPRGDLIKGLGGALFREKIVASAAREFIVIVDESKEVPLLGAGCPVPVEVPRDRTDDVAKELRELGADPVVRAGPDGPYVTDNGNHILDAVFEPFDDPSGLEQEINALPGVLENGIFAHMVDRVIVATAAGVKEWVPANRPLRESAGC